MRSGASPAADALGAVLGAADGAALGAVVGGRRSRPSSGLRSGPRSGLRWRRWRGLRWARPSAPGSRVAPWHAPAITDATASRATSRLCIGSSQGRRGAPSGTGGRARRLGGMDASGARVSEGGLLRERDTCAAADGATRLGGREIRQWPCRTGLEWPFPWWAVAVRIAADEFRAASSQASRQLIHSHCRGPDPESTSDPGFCLCGVRGLRPAQRSGAKRAPTPPLRPIPPLGA